MLEIVILVSGTLLSLVSGIVVLSRNYLNRVNLLYALFVFSLSLFTIFNYYSLQTDDRLFFIRSVIFFSALAAPALYFMIYYLRHGSVSLSPLHKVSLLWSVVILCLAYTRFVFSGLDFGPNPAPVAEFGVIVYSLYLMVFMGWSFSSLFQGYRTSTSGKKDQYRLMMIGMLPMAIFSPITGIIMPTLLGNNTYVFLSPVYTTFFVLMVGYAIIRHKLFDVRLVVARSLAYLLSILMVAFLFAFGSVWLIGVFSDDAFEITSWQRFVFAAITVMFAFAFQSIKIGFDKVTNKLFYRDAYNDAEFIDELNRLLVSTYDLQKLLVGSSAIIQRNIKADYCSFIIRSTEYSELRVLGGRHESFTDKEITVFDGYFRAQEDKVVIVDALEVQSHEFVELLKEHDIAVIIQLATSSDEGAHEVGYIVLGPKKSGNSYNLQDLKVLRIIGNEMVISTQNALRFEEIQQFNLTLQEKIEDATRKLKASNKKLLEMDETKDEFISMASHQLRTPLTSVKGYISMLLDEDGGKITDMQNKMLSQAFISTQRVISLIADLLNVSRLKTGKFVVNPSKVNIVKMIEGEISQLKELAAARNTELEFEAPEHFPYLMLDEAKIRQVIMNYVDNSIYYTPAGGKINIELKDNPETVELRVIDNGIGVPEADKHHMFSKFYRADNAKKARPDGTGLGLFMAKKVVLAHGGSTIFESEEGEGSTFGFVLNKKRLDEITSANKKHNSKTLIVPSANTTEEIVG
jgi:signal transduction histidine kinase